MKTYKGHKWPDGGFGAYQFIFEFPEMREKNQMAREPIHVGEHIADELEEMKMSPAAFAKKLKIPVKKLKEILDGKRDLDADIALRLGHFFNTGLGIWMRLQQLYEIRTAEKRIGKIIKTLPKLPAPKLKRAA